MPPDDIPLTVTARHFSLKHIPLPVYLGLDVELKGNTSYYSISVHDGSYTTDYYNGELLQHDEGKTRLECIQEAAEELRIVVNLFATAQRYKVQIISCSKMIEYHMYSGTENARSVMSHFWKDLDAIPFRVTTHGETSDERASAAVRKAVMWLSPQYPGNLPRISVGFRHEVEVDFNSQIHMVDLEDYTDSVCLETWRVWEEISQAFKDRQLRLSFFNSTPQGGGVALMRHALVRFLKLQDIDIHWFVARPKPEVFEITKRKFHNVLQGVAPAGTRLTEEEKQRFIDWSDENVTRFWLHDDGPIKNSDVIVIDDPQLIGIIPHIKKNAPNVRIIYRSHIEIRADLIRKDPNGPQAETWNFLWSFIKHVDLFISHPVNNFVPDVVPRRNVVLLPACTDPVDGLNKEMNTWCIAYYRSVFNRICLDQGAQEVDWSRPYIVQVARFDPSKGIPDVLESYRMLRLKFAAKGWDIKYVPQLVICGQGSIDDPDGTVIYEQTHRMIGNGHYADIAADIIVTRLPGSDQLLNMILRGAHVALQLSYREGFEVKVTEALAKGVPVVVYKAGGIPLQIQDGVTGMVVPIGDVQTVTDILYELFDNKQLHSQMSAAAKANLSEEFFTVWNSMSWLHLCNELTNTPGESNGLLDEEATYQRNARVGDARKVCDLWKEKYNYLPLFEETKDSPDPKKH
ncbi:hypothetical protein DFQ28_005623 [Apophysomyces sp. BC1034]|nr:hypothetical protein DFQ30_001110 [Apophysomyces sp. BC1015]KAG0180739.1 hypothetical protein DFQ29_010244 [Apophysomyces sp. BC1021]KAG0187964.1 hypothetical protein DFQ28_005623 [Apophysomyces sp. BC1034]